MDKETIKAILHTLPFPPDSFWVLMGAAMVLHGIKTETKDIDIGCTDTLFYHLQLSGYRVSVNRMGKEKIRFTDEITIYRNWQCESVDFIDNLPVCDINTIIKNKQELSREKDLIDLQLISLHQGDDCVG